MGTLVEGYASVFGNMDIKGWIVHPGAYSAFLSDNPGIQVPLLWYHNLADLTGLPVGMTTALYEDEVGLRFEGELADSRLGRDVAALIEIGAASGSSLHFFGGSGTRHADTGIIEMDADAKVDEVSILTTGRQANLLATVGLKGKFSSPAAEVAAAIAAVREAFAA